MISRKLAPFLFGLILSGLMSCIVSGLATYRSLPDTSSFPAAWVRAWVPSWGLAFPVVLFVAPVTRWLVERMTR
jgi:hypothetical protein